MVEFPDTNLSATNGAWSVKCDIVSGLKKRSGAHHHLHQFHIMLNTKLTL